MKLFLIRHAQSANNALAEAAPMAEYLAQRSPEPTITELGFRQAQLTADHLASLAWPEDAGATRANDSHGYGFTKLFVSPMLRTLQTALPISKALDLQPEVWVDIHEHGGIFHGDPALGNIENFPGLTRQAILEQFAGYTVPDTVSDQGWWWGGYEEMEGCYERAAKVAAMLRSWIPEQHEERIALVSHGTFLDALIKALLGHDFATELYYTHYNTAISRIDFTPKGFTLVRYLNRTEHLTPELITR
jgi:broad specificity phosphatase PhoE